MASYSESFKISAVHEYGVLRSEGVLKVGNIEIKNVRQLCEFLDISTQSLYAWEKKFSGLKPEKNEVFDEGEINSLDETYNGEKLYEVDKIDSQESESDLMKLHLRESNKVSEKDFFIPVQDKKNIVKERVIFNQRYLGWMAGMLGIKGYSNMLVPQLKVAIGNELIKQSGLIDTKKASKKLKKNGDNL